MNLPALECAFRSEVERDEATGKRASMVGSVTCSTMSKTSSMGNLSFFGSVTHASASTFVGATDT